MNMNTDEEMQPSNIPSVNDYQNLLAQVQMIAEQYQELHARLRTAEMRTDPMAIDNWPFSVEDYIDSSCLIGEKAVAMGASFLADSALQFWRRYRRDLEAQQLAGDLADFSPLTDFKAFDAVIRDYFFPTDYVLGIRDQLDRLRQYRSVQQFLLADTAHHQGPAPPYTALGHTFKGRAQSSCSI
ncbi:hypothetical protein EDD86DRAFT_214680 [Gorgonomyces haynaldii]|nr:hypothetical protein EDD86DRAFT_214680 [Gorgonomyces haynaldii]